MSMESDTSNNILAGLESPSDLRKLKVEQLPAVCDAIRQTLISELSQNPGHFASSMGAVELTVAIHYVFNTPEDRIVWDVGHQAYGHKLLTGRREAFHNQRRLGGISGFPNPAESEYDTFVAGHASNSISAALGMSIADKLNGLEDRKTVAVIGDASIGTGLAFEGLNNASNNPNNLLIILNDNDMSIDDNVGAMHRYLTELTTSPRYNRVRYNLYNALKNRGVISVNGKNRIQRFNNSLKALISHKQNIFEGLNIRYFGPFDGHDVVKLVKVLNDIKEMKGPRILHLRTVKGKGYEKAEENPTTWHAPGKFDPKTGERKKSAAKTLKWQEAFGTTLVDLAEKDDRVVGITAAMPSGTSMNMLMERFPERTFDVGISEGHAVTFAGGLAVGGKKPFVAIYSSFLQRAYDNIINDLSIQGLPVTLCIDRAGIVGEDGVTHHGMFDIAYLRSIPGMTVASPLDYETLRNLMYTSLSHPGPFAIRYPRGGALPPEYGADYASLEIGRGRKVHEAKERASVAILSFGPIGENALQAARELEQEGISVDVYDLIWAKPLDTTLLDEVARKYRSVVTLEDGAISGGVGTAVMEHFDSLDIAAPALTRLGVGDQWVHHGTVEQLQHICGYDVPSIKDTVRKEASK